MATNLVDYQSHFLSLFNSKIHITPLDFHELPSLVARTMEAADKYTTLTGDEKHTLVLDVLSRAIKGTEASELKKETALDQLDSIIDNFINVSKGAISVDKREVLDPKTTNLIQIGEKVYKEVREMFDDDKITLRELVKTLPFVVSSVIKVLNKVKKLKGGEKKQVAIAVINRLLDELPIPRETDKDRAKIKLYKKSVSSLIDTSIAVATGKINVNHVAELAKVGFSVCKLFCK